MQLRLKPTVLLTPSVPWLTKSKSSHQLRCLTVSSSSSSIQYTPWSGLQSWRANPLNELRSWGPNGPQSQPFDPVAPLQVASSLAELGAIVLSTSDPFEKSRLSHFAYSQFLGISISVNFPFLGISAMLFSYIDENMQVSPKEIPAPKSSGLPLNAYMLHNLAHVELNAIDLAWDTVVRFSPFLEVLGEAFFVDFAHVADDESRHFLWCSQRLAELGFKYGDMPAHNLLWRECEKSSDNVAARLAAIPLVQEARGLDAGPRLVQKLIGYGDCRTSNIVAKIADEEVAHVAVGVDWFISVCQKVGRVPCSTFKELLQEYNVELKGPFNYSARDEAGIPREWYAPPPSNLQAENGSLSEVYERLAYVISMEKDNSSVIKSSG
ncbi:unnamed protein product [Rhodiola kirilowii]